MELLEKRLPPDHNLVLFSDIHFGTIMRDAGGMERVRRYVVGEEATYALFLGDLAESIMIDDKRYDPDTTDRTLPLRQYQDGREYFGEFGGRLAGVLTGNHDWVLATKYGNLVRDMVCRDLGVSYGTYTAKVSVRNKRGRQMYKVFATHGSGRITSSADDPVRRESNMLLSLKRKLKDKAGDCHVMAMGHSHKLLVCPPMETLYLYDTGRELKSGYTGRGADGGEWIHPDHRWYVNTGSFLRLYAARGVGEGVSGYAERAGYDPTELGFTVLECRGGELRNVRKVVVG